MGAGESKAELRRHVYLLKEREVPLSQTAFWASLLDNTYTTDDIFSVVGPSDVRDILAAQPCNIRHLLRKLVSFLGWVTKLGLELTPPQSAQINNALRLITRVMPFLFESEAGRELVSALLWTETSGEDEAGAAGSASGSTSGGEGPSQPLVSVLFRALMDCCFLPNYTVLPSAYRAALEEAGGRLPARGDVLETHLVWASGVAVPQAHEPGHRSVENRTVVVRCLLACASQSLFVDAAHYATTDNPWLNALTAPALPHAKTLFYSLLNTIISYEPTNMLPYSMVFASDPTEPLVDVCAQLLLLCLDWVRYRGQAGDAAHGVNMYRQSLCEVREPAELAKVFHGMVKLLTNVVDARDTWLPYSTHSFGAYQEVLILVWKWLDYNDAFLEHVLRYEDVTKLVFPLLCFMYDGRDDVTRAGIIHICTFVLLLLSGDRSFGVALNKEVARRHPQLPKFGKGNYADLLIVVCHKLVVSPRNPGKLESLYNCLLTIIANVSPYIKTLHMVPSVKLVKLFEVFSAPRFLYAAEHHHHYLFFLLEIFNNLIQYQYEGNTHLVYAILVRRGVFEQCTKVPVLRPRGDTAEAPAAGNPAQAPAQAQAPAPAEVHAEAPAPAEVHAEAPAPAEVHAEAPAGTPGTGGSGGASAGAEAAGPTIDPTARADAESDMPALVASPAVAASGVEGVTPTQAAMSAEVRPAPSRVFVPTTEWIVQWKHELPIQTVQCLLDTLVPRVEALCGEKLVNDEDVVLEYLKQTTMVGLLPVPHPIIIRKYQSNEFTSLWFTTLIWGVTYMRNQDPPLFDGNAVRLFSIAVV